MLKSMTGFGRANKQIDGFDITVEIKSVNHRYFEFSARLPRVYQFLEEKLKSYCQQRIERGKVELSVFIEDNNENNTVIEINKDYADAYISSLKKLAKQYKIKNDLSLSAIAGNGDLFKVKRKEADAETITNAVLSVTESAVDEFIAMREVEGEKLRKDVIERSETILSKIEFIESKSPETVENYRQRLEEKMKELLGSADIDSQRILTETAVFADKIAVDEETVRLRSHISQLHSMLDSAVATGKKLDFLVQEMNRETNTIGSKAQNLEIAHTVVDIKAEIEKIREQIQNIE